MSKTDSTHETRLSVRLKGPLAEHADRQVASALYESHSEYIRDLIRRDMNLENQPSREEIRRKIKNGYTQLAEGNYREVSNDDLFRRAEQELNSEGVDVSE